jgi:hypothetical protein
MTMIKSKIFFQAIFLVVLPFRPAFAECNNPSRWEQLPGNDTRLLIGFRQKQRSGFGETSVSSSATDNPYPILLKEAELITRGDGKLSKEDTSYISYYERVLNGLWRICRLEAWLPPAAANSKSNKSLIGTTSEYISANSKMAQLTAGHLALFATQYFYDDKGRISRIEVGDFEKPGQRAEVKICRRYDDKDRLLLFLNPHTTNACPSGVPDVRDEWLRYRYGENQGTEVILLDEWHHGNAEGRWSKKFEVFRVGPKPGDIWGAALAKSEKGVTTIYGSNTGKLDDNSANTVVDEFGRWNGSTYFFTRPPVPLEVLENPELIYKYERRRQTYIDGNQIRLFELFKPNEHISHHRYYYVGEMIRNEQLDPDGKVKRVVTVNDYRQPRPGPHPDVDDKLLKDTGLRLIGHQVYHRIYDFDAQGKPTLVAASWNRKVRLSPLKRERMDFAEVVFGTPDGKVRWKSLAEFEKFFGFSSNAAEVFPDEIGRRGEDDD